MGHPLPPNLGLDDFDPAFLANDTTMLHALVLAAVTFVVFGGAKYFCAEKTIALRFERSVIDGLRLFDFTTGPLQNLFG